VEGVDGDHARSMRLDLWRGKGWTYAAGRFVA
jgi:hypothetical protein